MAKRKKIIPLEQVTDDQLAVCAKHCGLDEFGGTVAEFMYAEDRSASARRETLKAIRQNGYTRADITDPDCISPIK